MKTRIINALAVMALAAFGSRATADDHGYRYANPPSYTGVTGSVPLLFYTGKQYSSSIYGSPGSPNCYFGSSTRSSKYYRYQANPWYDDVKYVRYVVVGSPAAADLQSALAQRGYYSGAIDGVIGPMSRSAIWRYQDSHGLAATGAIDYPLLRSLGLR